LNDAPRPADLRRTFVGRGAAGEVAGGELFSRVLETSQWPHDRRCHERRRQCRGANEIRPTTRMPRTFDDTLSSIVDAG
jgi:hypothetical protein